MKNQEMPKVQTQEIKIELTKLYGLHSACIKLEHGTRRTNQPNANWKSFSPSRFIYSYFTFNSIYSYDWEKSLQNNRAIKWTPKYKGGKTESEQFEELLSFYYTTLGDQVVATFIKCLSDTLSLFAINDPDKKLKRINASNETKSMEQLRGKFPHNFDVISNFKSNLDDHHRSLLDILKFIYAVRNNVFHGSKTKIQMNDLEQQARLLVYSAVLISSNALLFSAVKKKNIGWRTVPISF